MRPRGEFLSLEVPGLAEGRPSVLVGDKVILMEPYASQNSPRYEGFVHEVNTLLYKMMFTRLEKGRCRF